MRKSIFILILIFFWSSLLANNTLIRVSVTPLPNEQARIDFQFEKKIKELPSTFMTHKPKCLVLDFVNTTSQLDNLVTAKKLEIGSLIGYNIIMVQNRVRVLLDLTSSITYSGTITGNNYTLTLNGKSKHFFKPTQEVFNTNQHIVTQYDTKKNVYSGKLISLNFQTIQVRSVLQLLADFTGINMVVSDKVTGDITLRLNNTPWDQALDIILATNSLDKRQTGNVMWIAPAIELMKRQKDELKSQKEVTSLAPLRSDLIQLNYAKAIDIASLLKDKSTSLLSKRGAISVDARTNTIWIQDTEKKIDEIRKLVKRLDIPVRQVQIEARIVNVTREGILDLGIRFGMSTPEHISGTIGGATHIAQGIAPATVPIVDRLNLDLVAPVLNPATLGVAVVKLGEGVLLDLELSALESDDKAEIIASPRLTTINQQPAMIEAGEEIPYQESTANGSTTVAFKKAVLSLKVTPQITPDNKLLMDLQINQDSPSGREVNGVPAILTKQIHTNVLVENGQTVVLGGIYQQDKNNTVRRIPFLGKLPVVGILFRNIHHRIRNEELLIFITPRIITNSLSIAPVSSGRMGNDKFEKPMCKKC